MTYPPVGTARELGPVEQLVLRGDGLTTTSLEILTDRDISVRVRRHWHLALPALPAQADGAHDRSDYTGIDQDAAHAAYMTVGYQDLAGVPGDDLLIREVLLCDDDGDVYATASLVAVLSRLPSDVTHRLATTRAPIGKLLVRAGLQVRREIRQWGLLPAGDFAGHLGPAVEPHTPVPARTYLMRNMGTGQPLTLITEWFSPQLFDAA